MIENMRRVVTAFIEKQAGEVLLLKRSELVHTFQKHWAGTIVLARVGARVGLLGVYYSRLCVGVSGTIESNDASALLAAQREIHEETGLGESDLTFIRSGRPLHVQSKYNTVFIVHPFLFKLRYVHAFFDAGRVVMRGAEAMSAMVVKTESCCCACLETLVPM
jgi:8-oxo-dGTP pyrophosphatase MutT (NUDIX family)